MARGLVAALAGLLVGCTGPVLDTPVDTPFPPMMPPTPSPAPIPPPSARGEALLEPAAPPLGHGFYGGGAVSFMHTEASNRDIAGILWSMTESEVFVVPALASVPAEAMGGVFVFQNGVFGEGPLGFQGDVFDSIPGQPRYTPLRAISFVAWREGVTPRELRSVREIREDEARGEVTVTQSGVVVNMPIVTWPGGRR